MNAPLRFALALSALVHALFCVWVEVRGKKSEPVAALTPDRFSGNGIEVEAIPVDRASANDAEALAAREAAAREAAAREAAAREAAAAAERETKTPPAAAAVEAAEPSAASPTQSGPAGERPRKPRRIPPKPQASSPPSSNTERLAALPMPQPSAGSGASSATASAASGSASAASVAGTTAPYGAAGLPPGVRHLPRAFTRALALANRGDTRWREVAAGRVGEAHLRLAVDAEGQLGELEYATEAERDRLAPVVKKLFDNTLLLLKNGRFSVDPRTLSAGVTRLRVMVEVTDGGPRSAEGDPVELFGLASAAPEPGKPGKSGFILNSGRQVTAWVWLE